MQERCSVSYGGYGRHRRPIRHAEAATVHQARWTNLPFETWWAARREHDSGSGATPCTQESRFLEGRHARIPAWLQPALGTIPSIASSDSPTDGTRIGKHDCALHRRNSD